MTPSNIDIVRGLYGFNWVAVSEREHGATAALAALHPEIQARVSPEVGDRTLDGLEGFLEFVQSLEEDFSEFRYDAEKFSEPARDAVLVTGRIHVRGRFSKFPLASEFGHRWVFRDGKALSIRAHLDAADAAR